MPAVTMLRQHDLTTEHVTATMVQRKVPCSKDYPGLKWKLKGLKEGRRIMHCHIIQKSLIVPLNQSIIMWQISKKGRVGSDSEVCSIKLKSLYSQFTENVNKSSRSPVTQGQVSSFLIKCLKRVIICLWLVLIIILRLILYNMQVRQSALKWVSHLPIHINTLTLQCLYYILVLYNHTLMNIWKNNVEFSVLPEDPLTYGRARDWATNLEVWVDMDDWT